jgi:drug/metabolite transporter (DMT)-like permease
MNQRLGTNLWVHLALLAVAMIYSANNLIAKIAMPRYIGSNGLVLVRVTGAIFLFFIAHVFMYKKIPALPPKKIWKELIICALCGVTCNMLLFFKGLDLTQPINAGVIMVITPLLVTTIGIFVSKKKPNVTIWVGIILGLGGAWGLILVGKKGMLHGSLGDFYIFLNAVFYSIYLIRVKPLMKEYAPLWVVFWIMVMGWVFLLFAGFQQVSEVAWTSLPSDAWLSIGFVIVFTTFFAYQLNIWALKYAESTLVGAYIYLQPLFTAILAVLYGLDFPNSEKIWLGISIIAGVYLVSSQTKKYESN